jgi:hypothetical protein
LQLQVSREIQGGTTGDNILRQLYDSKGIELVITMLPPSSNSKILTTPPVDNPAKDYDSDEPS